MFGFFLGTELLFATKLFRPLLAPLLEPSKPDWLLPRMPFPFAAWT